MSENTDTRITMRLATREDVPFILQMITELADYEQALDKVHASTELLERWLFDQPAAECLIGTLDGVDRGIAIFYTSFSTWESKPGLFLEDLVVQEAARGNGLGKAFFSELARIALQRGYPRIEWNCLDWNEPSLRFYASLGAFSRNEWIGHRLTEDRFEALARL